MKKVALLAIALSVIATPVLAGVMVISTTNVTPLVGGQPGVLNIGPVGETPVVDLQTGLPVVDPFTGMQKMNRTWSNYMYFYGKTGAGATHFQSVKLEKIHPERKVACGAGWNTAPNTVLQQGKDEIMLLWPLLYEVDGTEFRLTITYSTDNRIAYPSPYPANTASRIHVEVYKWIVVSNTWAAFQARLDFFAKLPAGVCETFAVTPLAYTKIGWFVNGFGSTAFGTYVPGIQFYIPSQPVQAAQRFSALEEYIDSICAVQCSGLYASGLNVGTPSAKPGDGEAILDNPTVPAASVLLNDLWAVGKALNILWD